MIKQSILMEQRDVILIHMVERQCQKYKTHKLLSHYSSSFGSLTIVCNFSFQLIARKHKPLPSVIWVWACHKSQDFLFFYFFDLVSPLLLPSPSSYTLFLSLTLLNHQNIIVSLDVLFSKFKHLMQLYDALIVSYLPQVSCWSFNIIKELHEYVLSYVIKARI